MTKSKIRRSQKAGLPTSIYFKDVFDHTIIAIETVETYRDILAGLLDIYLSSVSNRLNEIMKVLHCPGGRLHGPYFKKKKWI